MEMNKKKRNKSREIVIRHLRESCQTIYKPKTLEKLNNKINEHTKNIEELEIILKRLEKEKNINAEALINEEFIRDIRNIIERERKIVRRETKELLENIKKEVVQVAQIQECRAM
jgi:hypothetical protein